ncbi:hypothetical protein ACL02T_15875 [Pseudonocardia sp. RS010]|uniref:hypothetical protein n=1 Tax=Pseudonocardia sp. RS010 TaxID=3385979 RepID=UPI0039A1827C
MPVSMAALADDLAAESAALRAIPAPLDHHGWARDTPAEGVDDRRHPYLRGDVPGGPRTLRRDSCSGNPFRAVAWSQVALRSDHADEKRAGSAGAGEILRAVKADGFNERLLQHARKRAPVFTHRTETGSTWTLDTAPRRQGGPLIAMRAWTVCGERRAPRLPRLSAGAEPVYRC